MAFKIGDKVWRFDGNRRVYVEGNSTPIYSEHFYQDTIVGETPKSWLIHYGRVKINKKTLEGIYTDEQRAAMIWDKQHRYKIVREVQTCSPELLKQIAELIGYKEVN